MIQLGQYVQHLIALLADNYDPENPFVFSKLDIKDGFWRMAVSSNDAWNFCYVPPQADPDAKLEDKLIVMPNFLQKGWCESLPLFCEVSETTQDVIEALLLGASLPEHPFREKMLDMSATLRLQATIHFSNLVEVFVDDFIGATNNIRK